jgi:hypothetical protein
MCADEMAIPRYGVAYDGGALNRVVEPGVDDLELQKLDLFLSKTAFGGDTDPALFHPDGFQGPEPPGMLPRKGVSSASLTLANP